MFLRCEISLQLPRATSVIIIEKVTATTNIDDNDIDDNKFYFLFAVVFRAVRYTLSGRECVYTDGGLLDQYPIHCFDGRSFTFIIHSFIIIYYFLLFVRISDLINRHPHVYHAFFNFSSIS